MSEGIRLKKGAVEWREVEGEVVALDLERSEYFSINQSGAQLWAPLVEGTTATSLMQILMERFDIDQEQAARDVDAFLAGLRERNLLEPDA